jgi:predicted DNA-binding transcriptional regulator YafY
MLGTSARLLRLLSLFQGRRYWSGADLASRLEITARTLRRDVDRLRSLGYPVHSTAGKEGGYQLGAGATLPPLLLDDEEAVAVAVGLRTAASGTVTGMEEASVRALLKLEQVLPSRLRRRVNALHSFIVPMANRAPTIDVNLLSTIAGACRDNDGLCFGYCSHDGTSSARTIEPHRLVYTGNRWYLVAWDVTREDWRTFRVDRIDGKPSIGSRFTPRKLPDKNVEAYISRSVSYAQYAHRARVILHVPLETAAAAIPPTTGMLEAIDKKRCMLHIGSQSLDSLAAHLALHLTLLGFDFEISEPPALADSMCRLAKRLLRAAKNSDFVS